MIDFYVKYGKNLFDRILAIILFVLVSPLIFLCFIIACFDTLSLGIYFQVRYGKCKRPFWILKIKTMRDDNYSSSSLATLNTHRISKVGFFLRKYKLDELPQLINIIKGDMSFVGPRPEVLEYVESIPPEYSYILDYKPGLTGPASIFYSNEESLLARADDARVYYDAVIWPHKIRLNAEYVNNISFVYDISLVFRTIMHRF